MDCLSPNLSKTLPPIGSKLTVSHKGCDGDEDDDDDDDDDDDATDWLKSIRTIK